jgi:hypothetical protein
VRKLNAGDDGERKNHDGQTAPKDRRPPWSYEAHEHAWSSNNQSPDGPAAGARRPRPQVQPHIGNGGERDIEDDKDDERPWCAASPRRRPTQRFSPTQTLGTGTW